MSRSANALRGETAIMVGGTPCLLRPSFSALVAAEEELGPLFALVERAGAGQLRLAELAALFWHCLAEPGELSRAQLGEGIAAVGLASASKPLRVLLAQILQGDAAPPPE